MSLEVINNRIEDLYKEWNSLQPLNPDNDYRLWRKIKLEWNYNSNRIEGNTLSYNETEILFIHGRFAGNHQSRDYKEMEAHNLGIEKVRKFAEDKERPMTEEYIRNLNLIILKEPFWKEAETLDGQTTKKKIVPGKYKTQPNHVRTGTGEVFMFALPQEVPEKMGNLMNWFNENIESRPTSISSFLAELHHRFICIHPFDDGNGRTARLWINYALMRLGYPPIVIKAADKDSYISALQKADTENMDALAVYLGNCLISWLEVGIGAAQGSDISEPDDVDKEVDVFIRNEKAKGTESPKPLAGKDLERLCEQSWIPLLETFENRFSQFSQLFSSTEIISGWPGRKGSLGDLKKDLKELLEKQETDFGHQRFGISYKEYRMSPKPFDMLVELSIDKKLYDIEYAISTTGDPNGTRFPYSLKKEKHARLWTESEIRKFVAEGKKDFLEVLKEIVAKTENDDS